MKRSNSTNSEDRTTNIREGWGNMISEVPTTEDERHIERGNLASVVGTLPAGKELDEIFLL